ncbi:MAG: outer membrane protein transport protein [Muribaculaceae bacterium]|nr:outer membrane protein transport protein [Muribaculaceae bacterium]
MKKTTLVSIAALAASIAAHGQSAVDAYSITQSDLRGTARYMSMAGAFGALGADLSSLNSNPAGIGVYRGSQIGLTLDLDVTSSKTTTPGMTMSGDSKTHFACNNFGYVGTIQLGSDSPLRTFSWGATYSRVASFDRDYQGAFRSLGTSMTNYIAGFSNGYEPGTLSYGKDYNPYTQSNADWLSILAYNSYMINSVTDRDGYETDQYQGLFQNGSSANSEFYVRERGHLDEYSINFGGNLADVVYWGIGIGISDLTYSKAIFYDEEIDNALAPDPSGKGYVSGQGESAYFSLNNYKRITGNGFNFKLGVIVKPIDEFRLGFAVHTPTYFDLNQSYGAETNYSYSTFVTKENPDGAGSDYSDDAYFGYKLRSPWRLNVSAATVIGGRFILSAEYEYAAYDKMKFPRYEGYGFDDLNSDIKNFFQTQNTLRLGAEFRVTPQLSLRAGYSYSSSNVKADANDGNLEIFTSGTDPSFTFNSGSTQYVTCGLGYSISRNFSIDAAYVHKQRESTFHPFTSWDTTLAPTASLTSNDNNIVLTATYKF